MVFGMADRANALVAEGVVNPATRDDSPPSQPTTETTDTAKQTNQTTQESADTSRPATGEAGGQATGRANASEAPKTDTAKTEEGKTGTGAAEGTPSAESVESASDTAAVTAAVNSDDPGNLPAHLIPRFREMVQQKNDALRRADVSEKRAAELEAAFAANNEITGQTQTSTVEGYVPPASLTQQETEQLAQAGFTGAYAAEDYQKSLQRTAFVEKLQAQVREGGMLFDEAEETLAKADAIEAQNVRNRDIAYREQKLNETESERRQREVLETAKAASVQALKDHEFADPEMLAGYVANGADPQMAAEYLHSKVLPIVERERTAAAENAVAPVRAAYEKQIAELTASHEAAINKILGRRAIPSTIGVGNGGAAPNMGTETPKPTGRFNMREKAEHIRQAMSGIGR